MQELMATEKIRLVILADEEIRAALRLAAGKRGTDMSPVAEEILRDGLLSEIEEVRELRKAEGKRKHP